ncbi:tol-pal system protein YbgF [Oleisolibacter albus]|uniref:tol-pal system protein YbgF n=1 Tax=Oleisolibacter albus TaxID=2171757 RepID=UPI00138FD3FA|nr:tol-pal system protein YbgF [Oleisolibacter albus]
MRLVVSSRRFRHLLAASAAIALLALVPPGSASAQSGDMRELMNRLDRLESDVQSLSRTVYRGGAGGSPSGGATPGAAIPPSVAGSFEARLQRLESDMATLNGRYEEATYQIGQLREQMQKMQQDLEFRLQRLEQGGGMPAAADSGASTPAAAESQSGSPSAASAGSSAGPSAGPSAGTPAKGDGGNLPGGSAQDQYDNAFNLLRQTDYAGAEKAFTQFLKANPNHALAANAEYWLGESLYARNKFKEAAIAFAEGYTKYPKSNKAPDSLLKLGLSLSALKRNEEACAALGELQNKFKDAPATIKRRADQERNRLKCS